ncbi:uncharacterized protein PHACADRAFT_262523 [Phanerochaete carnosa HHB-10118-sp]|uniref:BZIP domain-containing protein n=1 Tax=Phanerochaete carnosa (strain HHB-10118-sp) TaxID=650164 RepID=K5VKY7_PHACS|nr:uncharacterized protein PHACADRAFT_262523 [Phanerochaete carnosa HHB-10118-sp]EKM52068.1 hypothetical protein PHACADRAFT_262523 [Phanerochaete carnosa HHB-10118-sp]
MSSGPAACSFESTADPSSSKARCLSPSPLSIGARVKSEMRTPRLGAYQAFPGRSQGELPPTADAHSVMAPNKTLTPSSPFRHHRPPTLLPPTPRPNTAAALYPHQFVQSTHHPHHDVLALLNASLLHDPSETAGQHGSPHLQLPPPRDHPSSQHVSINSSPWTSSHPVFTSTSALAAHHGIPQSLPPVPRTTRYLSEKQQPIPSSSTNTDLNFDHLVSNYLNMLSQKPLEQSAAPSAPTMSDDNAAALQAVLEVIQASPEFQQMQDFGALTGDMPGDYDSFLTSPMEESPYEDMLPTPALGNGDFDYLTSPAIVDADDFGAFAPDVSLFGDSARFAMSAAEPKAALPVPAVQHSVDFDVDGGLYTMSPETPALDPTSLQTSPLATPITPSLDTPVSAPRRKNAPTGTRKNITPEALVPVDAPIQTRNYATPSATSRKAVPAGFAKKRALSQAFDEEDGESLLDPNDLDAIEAKRRQNTLAARRSRRRKLEYQRELETSLDQLTDEKDQWKRRAEALEAVLRSHGLEVPSVLSF